MREIKKEIDNLKRRRFEIFVDGFQTINQKLK